MEKTFLSVMSKQQVSEENARSAASLLVGQVLIGELHPNSFIKALAEQGNIPLEKARAIARDISAQVFAPVRNELMSVYQIGSDTSSATAPKIPAVPQQIPQTGRMADSQTSGTQPSTPPNQSANPPVVQPPPRAPATIVVQPPVKPTTPPASAPPRPAPPSSDSGLGARASSTAPNLAPAIR